MFQVVANRRNYIKNEWTRFHALCLYIHVHAYEISAI